MLGRYHVKVHLGLAVYPYNQNADLREIFAYKILEFLNFGPKVFYVPNVHYSSLGLYIVTEDSNFFKSDFLFSNHILVIGFRQADEVDMTNEQMAQRELIRRIFVLKDLHSANYGINDNGLMKIVDFKVLLFTLHCY